MVEQLLKIALIGGEPLLYLLLLLSFLSIAVVIERLIFYYRYNIDAADFASKLVGFLNKSKVEDAIDYCSGIHAAEAEVAKEGLNNFEKGSTVAGELMESMALKQQQEYECWLTFLATVGSNAPFIGLLGTVLGIIKAFHDLAFDTEGGPSVVMAGIAEALVATAVGLLVAIPAVVFFNYFKNREKKVLNNISQLKNVLLAFMESNGNPGGENKEIGNG